MFAIIFGFDIISWAAYRGLCFKEEIYKMWDLVKDLLQVLTDDYNLVERYCGWENF